MNDNIDVEMIRLIENFMNNLLQRINKYMKSWLWEYILKPDNNTIVINIYEEPEKLINSMEFNIGEII